MKKLILIVVAIGLVSNVFAEKIIYDKADGKITRLDNDGIAWDNSYIGGQVVIAPVDWNKISIGQGQDVYNTLTNIGPQVDPLSGTTNIVTNTYQVAKANISEVSDFVDLKVQANIAMATKANALSYYTTAALQLADSYGVTNRPLDWAALATAFAQDPTDQKRDDSLRSIQYSLFIQANGGDLTNVK